jgi:hypothetical protein
MKNLLLALLVISSFKSLGQYNSNAQTNMTYQTVPRGFLTGLPDPGPKMYGNPYFYEDKGVADIFLKDSTKIERVYVKLDMQANAIEIEWNGQLKILPVSRVLMVSLTPVSGSMETFVNTKSLPSGFGPPERLVKTLYSNGNMSLYCQADVDVKRGNRNPNPMINAEKQDDEIVVKKSYVIVFGKDVIETQLPKSKISKAIEETFGEKGAELARKTNFKNESDLLALVKQLDQLKKS